MGVYIKGMEMPSGCPYCQMSHWENFEFMGCEIVIGKGRAVKTDKEYAESPAASRPDWCPLVPVQPHGRLIDADKIYDAVEQRYRISSGIEHRCERDLLDLICSEPTVIPASEEGET